MNYETALSVLNSFTEKNPNIIFDSSIFKVAFEEGEKSELFINISVSQTLDEMAIKSKYNIANTFEYTNDKGENSNCKVKITQSSEIVAHSVKAGTQGRHIDLIGYGTYGWGFILDGSPVALSNWHVFCPHGNSTKLGTRVQINNQTIASLSFFEPISDSGQNQWDMALATFDNIADMQKAFTPCQDGNTRPYPNVIQSAKIEFGTPVYKVGARQPTCRDGVLNGVANIRVKYNDNVVRFFIGQLQFSKMTDPGDSGAVIVNATSNKVLGLNFAGNDRETFANPILAYDKINYVGTKFISDDFEIPVFETKKQVEKTEKSFTHKKETFQTESGVPPSLGGSTGKYAIVIVNNGKGFLPGGFPLTIDKIIDTYGSVWIKVSFIIEGGFGVIPGYTPNREGWINTNAPTFLYVNQ